MAEQPSTKSILVVEDDLILQGAMKMVLEWEGYRVSCAADGQEALDRLRRDNPPDLILLDWMLPVLDGGRFLEEQRQDAALAAIPVISVTALEAAACPEPPSTSRSHSNRRNCWRQYAVIVEGPAACREGESACGANSVRYTRTAVSPHPLFGGPP